jgi:hypothetical protein
MPSTRPSRKRGITWKALLNWAAALPGVVAFFLTDQYRPYPMVLMKLDKVRPAVAHGLLEQAWQREAPKRLVATRDVAKATGKALASQLRPVPATRRRRSTRRA